VHHFSVRHLRDFSFFLSFFFPLEGQPTMARNHADDISSTETAGEHTHLLRFSESLRSESGDSFQPESANAILVRARRLLYLSHLFNQFSENAWQFCLVLFLASFSNYESLILVCSYGLVSGLCVCLFGSAAGRFIDGANRLLVARRFIGTENFAVLLATLFCYILLAEQGKNPPEIENEAKWSRLQGVPTDPLSIFLLIGIHILGAAARILDSGFVVAIERDWIVVMSRFMLAPDISSNEQLQRQKNWLSETNVAMKQIDLSCKVVAPAFAGFFVALLDDGTDPHHGSDLRGAALFVGCLNAMALVVEYICTAKIYHEIPDLAIKSTPGQSLENGHKGTPPALKVEKKVDEDRCILKVPNGLKLYLEQPVSFAGVGLSLL
jgi:iron-regulated transporter 1